MEQPQTMDRPPNPRKGAKIWSVATFAYLLPTFAKGFRNDLAEEDMPQHLDVHASKKLGDRLGEAWRKELALQYPSLRKAIWAVFSSEFILLGFVSLFHQLILNIVQPLALYYLMKYYTQAEPKISENEAYTCAGVIVGSSFFKVLIGHNYTLSLQHFGMKLRVSCCSLIYRKSLRLSKAVLGGTTAGQMVNLLSNDVNRCDRAINHAHTLWVCPAETIIIAFMLYNTVGLTSTIGILLMVVFVPFQIYLAKKTSVFRLKTALRTDERIRLMNEIISGMQVIKMYAWEQPFAKLVAIVRGLELRNIRVTSYVKGVMMSCVVFIQRFSVFLTILTYVLLGNDLKAEYVFVVISFYNILKQAMTKQFSNAITQLAEVNVSITRIQKFLLYEETDTDIETANILSNNGITNKPERNLMNISNTAEIELRNVSAKWSSSSSDCTLRDINFRAQHGQLVAVIGPVGSGKSSLLHAILKELPLKSGSLRIKGTISYASQEPWVFAGSIQRNILFGQPMDRERYQEVIKVCALEQDLILFPYGDRTLVGERGVKLSGGQKARLSLARAIYRKADVYLLDDPLSAVDAQVGRQLFENCISKFLESKCTILVTHQLQYLQNVDNIFLVENGKIAIKGTYRELKESGGEFTKQLVSNRSEVSAENIETQKGFSKNIAVEGGGPVEAKEHRSFGTISDYVYISYFKAGGSVLIALGILFVFVLTQISASGADYFLTHWVNLEQMKSERNNTNGSEGNTDIKRDTFIYFYSSIVAAMVVLTVIGTFSFYNYCMKASSRLHDNMFSNVVHAPMRFFNTTSSGRILNRFAKDIGAVDEVLPTDALFCIQIAVQVIGVTVLIAIVKPWMLLVTVVIIVVFYLLKIVYLRTSRSIKRLEGITRSPVFGHMSASLQGLTTIRAYGVQHILEREFDCLQDTHSSVWYLFISCSRAFGFWLDMICVLYIATVTFSFFFTKSEEYGGNVGLAITQAISLTGRFQVGIRQWSELENQMTAVERILEYTKLEREPDQNKITPSSRWPEAGNIKFSSVSLKYSPGDPYVLNQLNFNIEPKEKIGIVGRTGAGKSSLIYALFQLAEMEGTILVDNVDITKVAFQTLRSKITIIPQEPVLFSGTLRKNLDPFEEYSDIDLWNALDEVDLKRVVSHFSSGLNVKMAEGGSNFSVGQRQLVCLARAIIRRNKILVLDEATANVDPQTDALIQSTIRTKFADCTVLTIAHRLQTIMDSDKVLVMNAGNLAEFNHPHLLLKNGNGLFYSLVKQTGDGMAQVLFKLAKDSFEETLRKKR